MGLSPYSYHADAGILCMILVQTVISISISISFMKENLLSILQIIRIRMAPLEEYPDQPATEPPERRESPSRAYMNELRSAIPTVRYESLSCSMKQECSVCLIEFKPAAEINRLCCGHVFHRSCLENWLNYWNLTCPLCRNRMIAPKEVQENTCPM